MAVEDDPVAFRRIAVAGNRVEVDVIGRHGQFDGRREQPFADQRRDVADDPVDRNVEDERTAVVEHAARIQTRRHVDQEERIALLGHVDPCATAVLRDRLLLVPCAYIAGLPRMEILGLGRRRADDRRCTDDGGAETDDCRFRQTHAETLR
ncbi:hypothetical protein ACFJIW_16275 [Tahibacter sp. UC22_41]|uniref:hypothetical protein n=1 Tax=Tahibacter sp. UC22_41 TaxID=3350178 RepID=UPI0036D8DBA3